MDGRKHAIKDKEPKTDQEGAAKSEVNSRIRVLSKGKDVTSVSSAPVLQKGRTDGLRSPPEAGVLGVLTDASAAPDIRSRPGGRSVEVCGPNAASGSGQLHPGKSIATSPKNSQQEPIIDSTTSEKHAQCSSTADNQNSLSASGFLTADIRESQAAPIPAPRSPAAENKDVSPKPARCSLSADIQDDPSAAPKPAPRTPRRFLAAYIQDRQAAPIPTPRSPSVENNVPPKPVRSVQRSTTADIQENLSSAPKPAPRTPTAEKNVPPKLAQLETLPHRSPTTDNLDASNPAPQSSASLRTPDDTAQTESQSNNQFITSDENISVWSSFIQIDRPLSAENICRICHESDQVEPLISPCLCRGSMSQVHRTCLQHWLAESDSSSCELCRFIYITKREPKYSVLGSVVAWIRQNRRQRKALLVDTLGMIAFVPFATMITYVAAALADAIEYQESPSWTDVTIRFAIVTFISLMTTIDVAYATYWMLRAQHHFSSWYSWYRRNSDVTLLPRPQQ